MAPVVENGFAHGRKDAAFLPLRAALGSTMIYHGLSKLKEERREATGQMFEQVGLRPGKPLAVATGAAEVFAGIASFLGFLTRPAALAVLVTQLVAIAKVHRKKGFDVMQGGFEYNLRSRARHRARRARAPRPASIQRRPRTTRPTSRRSRDSRKVPSLKAQAWIVRVQTIAILCSGVRGGCGSSIRRRDRRVG